MNNPLYYVTCETLNITINSFESSIGKLYVIQRLTIYIKVSCKNLTQKQMYEWIFYRINSDFITSRQKFMSIPPSQGCKGKLKDVRILHIIFRK